MWAENNMLDLARECSRGWRREESTMMYRAVCQPDGAHGGGPLSACQQIHIFHPAGGLGVLCISAFVWWVEGNMCMFLYKKKSILWWDIRVMFTLHLVWKYECPCIDFVCVLTGIWGGYERPIAGTAVASHGGMEAGRFISSRQTPKLLPLTNNSTRGTSGSNKNHYTKCVCVCVAWVCVCQRVHFCELPCVLIFFGAKVQRPERVTHTLSRFNSVRPHQKTEDTQLWPAREKTWNSSKYATLLPNLQPLTSINSQCV